MKTVVALTGSMIALLLQSACSSGGPSVMEGPDSSKILIAGSGEGGMDAQLAGRLALVAGNCLGVNAAGTEFLVAWPSGSVDTTEGGLSVDLDGSEYRIGDEVVVTGGAVAPTSRLVPQVPDECSVDEIFVVTE